VSSGLGCLADLLLRHRRPLSAAARYPGIPRGSPLDLARVWHDRWSASHGIWTCVGSVWPPQVNRRLVGASAGAAKTNSWDALLGNELPSGPPTHSIRDSSPGCKAMPRADASPSFLRRKTLRPARPMVSLTFGSAACCWSLRALSAMPADLRPLLAHCSAAEEDRSAASAERWLAFLDP
jgi:hypothetical protein